jgi:hypothetical protein
MEEMMTTKNTLMLSLLLYFISVMHLPAAAGRSDYRGDYQAFDRTKDILICQFDGRPDGDDVMSQAAIGSILMHTDYQDVRSYGVMHAYGKQRADYIHDSAEIFEMVWGKNDGATDYTYWAQADKDRAPDAHYHAAKNRVAEVAKEVLLDGGTVWVAEGGQSDFTSDWAKLLYDDPEVTAYFNENPETLASRVFVIHHADWNIKNTTAGKMNWVKDNLTFVDIPHGNKILPGRYTHTTPGYKTERGDTDGYALRDAGESEDNPNQKAQALWSAADRILAPWTSPNSSIVVGGLDFSDSVIVWWVLDMGPGLMTPLEFFKEFVINEPEDSPPGD